MNKYIFKVQDFDSLVENTESVYPEYFNMPKPSFGLDLNSAHFFSKNLRKFKVIWSRIFASAEFANKYLTNVTLIYLPHFTKLYYKITSLADE